jgi:OPT oligopeptide transporter protein
MIAGRLKLLFISSCLVNSSQWTPHGKARDRANLVVEATSLIMIAMSLGVILGYPTHLSWWAFFVSLIIAAVLVRTDRNHPGCHEYPNRVTEFIIGYMQPGRPMAIMLFKSYGYITLSQGLYFSIHKANLVRPIVAIRVTILKVYS